MIVDLPAAIRIFRKAKQIATNAVLILDEKIVSVVHKPVELQIDGPVLFHMVFIRTEVRAFPCRRRHQLLGRLGCKQGQSLGAFRKGSILEKVGDPFSFLILDKIGFVLSAANQGHRVFFVKIRSGIYIFLQQIVPQHFILQIENGQILKITTAFIETLEFLPQT